MSVCNWWSHLYEFCYYIIQWISISPIRKKRKRRNVIILPKYHIKPLKEEVSKKSHILWRWKLICRHELHNMKTEEKKEEASMWCSMLHCSWKQILWRHPSVHFFVHPTLITTLQATKINGSCSYLVQPLTLVGAWTLFICGILCSFPRIQQHFEIS